MIKTHKYLLPTCSCLFTFLLYYTYDLLEVICIPDFEKSNSSTLDFNKQVVYKFVGGGRGAPLTPIIAMTY